MEQDEVVLGARPGVELGAEPVGEAEEGVAPGGLKGGLPSCEGRKSGQGARGQVDLDRVWEEVAQHVVEGVGKRGGEGVEGSPTEEEVATPD